MRVVEERPDPEIMVTDLTDDQRALMADLGLDEEPFERGTITFVEKAPAGVTPMKAYWREKVLVTYVWPVVKYRDRYRSVWPNADLHEIDEVNLKPSP